MASGTLTVTGEHDWLRVSMAAEIPAKVAE
jgi:hypothetical protein